MITKENKIEKICSFYASDYHLEMIMVPYINRKIEANAKIIIMTERNLKQTVEVVVSKINLSKKRKQEILNIDWENNDVKKIKEIRNIKSEQELIVFVIGDLNYIENVNRNIYESIKDLDAKVIDCYGLEEAGEKMPEIMMEHSKVLNTTQEKEINEKY